MSTVDDLRADAEEELAADRCEALHTEPEGRPDPECQVCLDRREQRRQDAIAEGTACVAIVYWRGRSPGEPCTYAPDELYLHRNPDDSRAIDHEYAAPSAD